MNEGETTPGTGEGQLPEYEAPRIEMMVSSSELEREVHYAGGQISPPPNGST
ncbi:MAG: hypothetical protein ACSLFK_12845 [Gemmatimonadaceae bacterium]